MGRSVTVTGYGRASGTYDEATLRLAAVARAANPGDATARVTYAMGSMRDAVLRGGVQEHSLSTTNVTLSPVHDPWPTVVGYEATLGLAVKVNELAHIGTLLVTSVEAGGDGARVDGIEFTYRDPALMQSRARESAFRDARDKAEQFAGLAGQVLGEVRRIVEGGGVSPMTKGRAMALAADAGAPIDAGEGTLTAVVTVSWALGSAM
ncbi:MAG: SIMPL domain-containing protein [Actinomycetes bacterium]|jgi:uncharacterized protein YggE